MTGLVSNASKHPPCTMFEKTSTWKNIVPPRQLKPTVWNIMRNRPASVSLTVISHRKYTTELINYNFYETVSRIVNHSILAQDLMAEDFDFQKPLFSR